MSSHPNAAQVLTLGLPTGDYEEFAALAARLGHSPDELATKLCIDFLRTCQGPQKPRTLDEILAPVRQGFAESGATDGELDETFRQAREEVHAERQTDGPKSDDLFTGREPMPTE